MKLKFIGVGSAFSVQHYNSSAILDIDGFNLLIDAGGDLRLALHAANIDHNSIDGVYITHTHGDHIHGLEWLGFKSLFQRDKNKPKIKLFCPRQMYNELWDVFRPTMGILRDGRKEFGDYFDIVEVSVNGFFNINGTIFELVPVPHIGDMFSPSIITYGLQWHSPSLKKIWFSGDTSSTSGYLNTILEPILGADLIFHDCETSVQRSYVHANYYDLKSIYPDARRKMWLYHYSDQPLPDAEQDGFAGFVKQGQEFIL